MLHKIKNVILSRLRNRSGNVMVLFALSLSMIIGFAGLSIDIAHTIAERDRMQSALDAAVLAGAYDLKNTTLAEESATAMLNTNGFTTQGYIYAFRNNNKEMHGRLTRQIPTFFMDLFGYSAVEVSVTSAAIKGGAPRAFDYTLFSGSVLEMLTINGSSLYVGGSIHTNDDLRMNGSDMTVTGVAEAVGTITINGSKINVPNRLPGSSYVDMPDYSAAIISQATAAGKVYTGPTSFSGSGVDISSSIYVNGDTTINGSQFVGTGAILSTGTITLNGSNQTVSTSDQLAIYAMGDVIINGSNQTFKGIIYAPNGRVIINGSNSYVEGKIIAKEISLNGSSQTFVDNVSEITSIPCDQGISMMVPNI